MNIAQWPLPMITAETMDKDWYTSITEKLDWNNTIKKTERTQARRQLPFPAACRMCAPLCRCCVLFLFLLMLCCSIPGRSARWNGVTADAPPAVSPTCRAHLSLMCCGRNQCAASLQLSSLQTL
jgi:hypothetical protein